MSITDRERAIMAYRIGASLNSLEWFLSQAWVTLDPSALQSASQQFGLIVGQVAAMYGAAPEADQIVRHLRRQEVEWRENTRSSWHAEDLRESQERVEEFSRMPEHPLQDELRRECESFLVPVVELVTEAHDALYELLSRREFGLLQLGELIDTAIHPTRSSDQMFHLEEDLIAETRPADLGWRRPRSAGPRLFPPLLRDQVDGLLDSAWVREVHIAWRQSGVHNTWWPLGVEHESQGVGVAAGQIVELLTGIVVQFHRNPRKRLSWNSDSRTLTVGDCVLRSVRRSAINGILILDAFERHLWQNSVSVVSPRLDDEKRRYAANQLNEHLRGIVFKPYYQGADVQWAWRLPTAIGTAGAADG